MSSPRAVLEAGLATLAQLGVNDRARNYLQSPDWPVVERDIEWTAQAGNRLLTLHSTDYPILLRQIADPPLVLFVRGDPAVLREPQLAMVGSRNPSPIGRQTAYTFAKALAKVGLVITSGLALGIDAASHAGAIAGQGKTIAVAGNGLDRIYPKRHQALAQQIEHHGALVSEFPPGTPPRASHFPRRNRIISGMSLGVMVLEAAQRSGSLITARLAVEQGRDVFAVPGSIHNPMSRGCHGLIREGAKLVESCQDVLEELVSEVGRFQYPADKDDTQIRSAPVLATAHRQLLDNLGFEPTSVDVLVERTGLTADAVSSMLLELELQGFVASASGGLYSRSV